MTLPIILAIIAIWLACAALGTWLMLRRWRRVFGSVTKAEIAQLSLAHLITGPVGLLATLFVCATPS